MQSRAGRPPPLCLNPNCICHKAFSRRKDFQRIGFLSALANPKRILSFLCKHYGGSFRRQTFSVIWWQKKPHLDCMVYLPLVGCIGNRELARAEGIWHLTIAGRN
jgi:hypothetical protein